MKLINTGKRTEWSLIQSVILRVITKSWESELLIHEYDYRLTSDGMKSTYQLIIKNLQFLRSTRNKNTSILK